MTAHPAGRCPFPHGSGHRKTGQGEPADTPAVEWDGSAWHLRSYAAVRQVLRDGDRTRQGFPDIEPPFPAWMRQPVIFQDGPPHRAQRTAIARFFTPKTVSDAYQKIMERTSDQVLGSLAAGEKADLSVLSMALATRVAAEIVGLTNSLRPGMDRRLDVMLSEVAKPASRLGHAAATVRDRARMALFYLLDVRPAVRARRKAPREDVISHLLELGYSDLEILVECATYAGAGMVTTREFICVAAWHLLGDEGLRREYLGADQRERHRILHEILRLEPVASHLYRRATSDIDIEHGGTVHHIPAGALLDLDIRAANADVEAVGEEPLGLCPHRDLAPGVQPQALSFGDGAHRCPGAFVAVQESDVFLKRLLRLPLRTKGEPHLGWNSKLGSYEVRDFIVELDPAAHASGGA